MEMVILSENALNTIQGTQGVYSLDEESQYCYESYNHTLKELCSTPSLKRREGPYGPMISGEPSSHTDRTPFSGNKIEWKHDGELVDVRVNCSVSVEEQISEQSSEPKRKPFVIERFVLPQPVKDEVLSLVPDFGYGQFSEVVFYRTYSRVKADGSMESWNDVVIRCIEGILSIRKDWYIKTGINWDNDFWNTYSRGMSLSMFNMHWLPPGRGLWACGTDFVYERGSMALNNCGATVVDDDIGGAAHWVMDTLMLGVGVGFEPVRNDDFEAHWPTNTLTTFNIPDDREGWCESVRLLIDSYCSPRMNTVIFSYHLVRKAGLPIVGFGGVSSGPEPLIKLHERIRKFFEMYLELDWYDTILLKADIINAIGACVVAGNVRRSAEICLGSINDQVFLDLKNYERFPYRAEWGWLSNNSAILDTNEDYEKLTEISRRVIKNAEPGILNRQNIKYGRLGKFNDKVREDKATKINPCSRASSLVVTKTGIKRFDQISVGDEIWSETGWTTILNKWSNGYKDVYRWHTTTGHIDLTDNHRIVSKGEKIEIGVSDSIDRLTGPTFAPMLLEPQDIMDGFVIGDGSKSSEHDFLCIGEDDISYFSSEIANLIHQQYGKAHMWIVETTITDLPYTYQRKVPDRFVQGEPAKVAGFLRGLYSANGSFVGGARVTLKATSFSVIVSVSKMLSSLGIASYYTTNAEHDVEFRNGSYTCKQSYDLNISRKDDVRYFMRIIGFIQPYKNAVVYEALAILDNKQQQFANGHVKDTYDIHTVEYLGEEEVFDITVDNSTHTFWCDGFNISNCGEQPLENKELCNLVETFPTRCKDDREWIKATEYATVFASTTTLLPTHCKETNAVMCRNRRIGVGIVDFSGWKTKIGLNQVIKLLRRGYDNVRAINHWVQSEAGVPDSVRVTTMKPGGSVPKVAGRQAGMSHPNFHYMIRRVRIAMDAPMVPLLIEANVPYEVDVVSDNTYVFEFPLKTDTAKPASEVSVWEQAANLVVLQREWSDNAVSNTLTFIPEWELALSKLPEHLTTKDLQQFENKEYKVEHAYGKINIYLRNAHHEEHDLEHLLASHASSRGVYAQMPEEGITPEEYYLRQDKIGIIDWSKLRHSVAEPEKYCTGEACELPNK
jgi:ribonucleotide reductase alpha subunit